MDRTIDLTGTAASDVSHTSANDSAQRAFSALFNAESRPVFRYASSRVGYVEAEDVVAEVFMEAWRHRDRFDNARGSERAWLLGIATNVIARHRRAEQAWFESRARAMELGSDRASSTSDLVEPMVIDRDSETRENARILRSLSRMSRTLRDPLLLHELCGLAYEEVAAALDVPIGTVRSRINRARIKLKGATS